MREDENAKLKLQSVDVLENNEEYKNRKPLNVVPNKQLSLFIKVTSLDSEEYKRAYAFCEIFERCL